MVQEIGAHWICHGIVNLIHHASLIQCRKLILNLIKWWKLLICTQNLVQRNLIHQWNKWRNLLICHGNLLIHHESKILISHGWTEKHNRALMAPIPCIKWQLRKKREKLWAQEFWENLAKCIEMTKIDFLYKRVAIYIQVD